MRSRFACLPVRPAHRDEKLTKPRPEEWLLIEWPEGDKEPTKYWLSTLPENIEFAALVDVAKLRWRIERDYQELKQEVGLGHYEGRGWRGFHHHATMCIALLSLRAGDDSPLRTSSRQAVRKTCRSRRLPTPRRHRCGPSATFQIRSPPCADA